MLAKPPATRRCGVRQAQMVFTDRRGGVGRLPYDTLNLAEHVGDDPDSVAANRQRLADTLALPADRIVWMEQVHGRRVEVVREPRTAPLPATDALVTDVPGLALAVLVADCVPVVLADPVAGVVAVAHAGRTGAAAGILQAVIAVLVDLGVDLAAGELGVWLGPAVCGGCYEVPGDLQREVARALPGSATTTRSGTPGLDLRLGLAGVLTRMGVPAPTISDRCTMEDSALFSYRREARTGRQAAVAWLT